MTSTTSITVPPAVREQLRLAMLTADELVGAMREQPMEPLAQPPGCFRSRATLAVPRPLDPETAELRRLEVFLRPLEDGSLEVFSVRGLDLTALER